MKSDRRKLDGGLYLVSTPIGNARDITLRALDVLESADVLVAEDTRTLKRLMQIHGISPGDRPVLSYHDHNGDRMRPRILAALEQGQSVAYSSDAGTPLIADPGYDLARAAREGGHAVTAAPGVSAVVAGLSLSGLPTDRFYFGGFLPNAQAARKRALTEARDIPATLVFYEAPSRIAASLRDASACLGPARRAVLGRELTKKFEELRSGTLEELAASVSEAPVKGELVLMIDRAREETASETDIEAALRHALSDMSLRDAADLVSARFGLPRRQVYKLGLNLSGSD